MDLGPEPEGPFVVILNGFPYQRIRPVNGPLVSSSSPPKTSRCASMEAGATMMDSGSSRPAVAAPRYSLPPCRFMNEDVLFCVDVDVESKMEMKLSGPKGRPFTRLDAVRQAILLFVHSKLSINSDHRFAFSVLGQSVSWVLVSPLRTLFLRVWAYFWIFLMHFDWHIRLDFVNCFASLD